VIRDVGAALLISFIGMIVLVILASILLSPILIASVIHGFDAEISAWWLLGFFVSTPITFTIMLLIDGRS
jgi:hypothetical protein